MADIKPGDQWTVVSGGVGTAVVTDRHSVLRRIVWGGSYVGTLNVHDSSTVAGTTATSQIVSLPIPATQYPFSLELNANCKNGIVYQATGTPVMTLFWD